MEEEISRKVGHPPSGLSGPLPRVSLLLFLSFSLTVLGSLLVGQSFPCPFLWDEYGIILDNAAKGAFEWQNLPNLFRHRYFHIPGNPDLQVHLPYYRPVTVLFHALSYHAFGGIPLGYRFESLFLHVGNAVLLFVLFSAFFSRGPPHPNRFAASITATLIFFVHPRNVESVCIVANQTGLLCAFFTLLSLVFWMRILVGSQQPGWLYFASLVTLLLAMLAKENAYVAPLLHGLFFLVFAREGNKKILWLLSGYFLLVGVPLSARHLFLGGTSMGTTFVTELSKQGSFLSYLGSVMALLFHQLDQWFFPVQVQLFQYPFSPSHLSFREVGLPVFLCGGLVWRLRRERQLLAFCFAFFLIAYLPSSNLIPMGRLPGGGLKTGAHHLYLAQGGLALLVGSLLFLPEPPFADPDKSGGKRLVSWSLAAILVLPLALQTFRFAGYFRSADRFYQGVLERNPVYSGAWQNYGWHKHYLENKPVHAEKILLDGLAIMVAEGDEDGERKLVWTLLCLYLRQQRLKEAETLLQCTSSKWMKHPVGNHYLWAVVEGLRSKQQASLMGEP